MDPSDIGTDEDLAREVLVVARSIAPCIRTFAADTEEWKDALAILRRVYRDCETRGSRMVKAQRIGSASVDYGDIQSAFDGQPRAALRSLCAAAPAPGMPIGSFPTDRPLARIWPEAY